MSNAPENDVKNPDFPNEMAVVEHLGKSEALPPESYFQSQWKYEDKEPVIQYHMAAERCSNLSIWCAAMAGAEILKRKKEFGHGKGFTEWRNKLPFGHTTAANYVNLAKSLESRLNSLPKDDMLALLPALKQTQKDIENRMSLLSLPSPMDVFNPAHEQIATIVRHIANDRSLSQLLFDWGIVKQPKLVGGHHPSVNPPLTGMAREHRQAELYWTEERLAEFYEEGMVKCSWRYLSSETMRKIHDFCATLHANIAQVVNKKKD